MTYDPTQKGGGSNGVLDRILAETLSQSTRLGSIETKCEIFNEHLASIDRRLEQGSSQMRGYGTELAKHGERIDRIEHDAETRRRRCSDVMRRLASQLDDTGQHIIVEQAQQRTRMAIWKQALAALGLLVAIASAFGLGQCNHKSGAAKAPAHDAKVRH